MSSSPADAYLDRLLKQSAAMDSATQEVEAARKGLLSAARKHGEALAAVPSPDEYLDSLIGSSAQPKRLIKQPATVPAQPADPYFREAFAKRRAERLQPPPDEMTPAEHALPVVGPLLSKVRRSPIGKFIGGAADVGAGVVGMAKGVVDIAFDALTGKSVRSASKLWSMLGEPQLVEYRKAQELTKAKGIKDARAALADPEILAHWVAAGLPMIGPMAAHTGERIGSGDVAGGLGETAAILAPFALKIRGKAAVEPVPEVAPSFVGKSLAEPIAPPRTLRKGGTLRPMLKLAEESPDATAAIEQAKADGLKVKVQDKASDPGRGTYDDATKTISVNIAPIRKVEVGGTAGIKGEAGSYTIVDAPAPAANLSRNFRAGTNDATLTFASDTQQQLYDLAANERYAMRGGQNKTSNRAVKDTGPMKARLAEQLGISETEVSVLARSVHDDVRAQMKGVQHLETRAVVDNVSSAKGEASVTVRGKDGATRQVAASDLTADIAGNIRHERAHAEVDALAKDAAWQERAAAWAGQHLEPDAAAAVQADIAAGRAFGAQPQGKTAAEIALATARRAVEENFIVDTTGVGKRVPMTGARADYTVPPLEPGERLVGMDQPRGAHPSDRNAATIPRTAAEEAEGAALAERGRQFVEQENARRRAAGTTSPPLSANPRSAAEITLEGEPTNATQTGGQRGSTGEQLPRAEQRSDVPLDQAQVRGSGGESSAGGDSAQRSTAQRQGAGESRAEGADKVAERSLPQSLEAAGLASGNDLTYEVATNAATLERANHIVDRLGTDEAAKWLHASPDAAFSADHTAVGLSLIRRFQDAGDYQRAGEVAADLSAQMTRAGQAVQAAKLVAQFSPEDAVLTGQRILERAKPGTVLSGEQTGRISALARDLQTAQGEIRSLKQQAAELRVKEAVPLAERKAARLTKADTYKTRLETRAADALERIRQKTATQRGSGGPSADLIEDYAIYGASKLAAHGIDLARWTADMVDTFGEAIRPQLEAIRLRAYEIVKAERSTDAAARIKKPPTLYQDTASIYRDQVRAEKTARELAVKLGREYNSLDPVRRFKRGVIDALNTPRTLMASFDISAPARQGLWFYTSHPVESTRAFKAQISSLFKSPEDYAIYEARFKADPYYEQAAVDGVPFTHTHSEMGVAPGLHEEAFQSRAGKLWGVRHSEQAYSTFLNEQRLRVYKLGAKQLEAAGITHADAPKQYEALADYIATGSGRAKLPGKLEQLGAEASTVLFAPRYMVSRFKLLNPKMYYDTYKASPAVGKMALRNLMEYTGFLMGSLTLAKLSGANVDLDPGSPDFLKVRAGKAHYDISGGLQQEIRFMLRFGKAAESQLVGKLDSEPPLKIVGDFVRRKLAPVPGLAVDALMGERIKRDPATGKPLKFSLLNVKQDAQAVGDMITPLIFQDMWDAYQTEAAAGSDTAHRLGGAAATLPGAVGFGVQYYQPKPPIKRKAAHR